jgi:hypothetical protein
MIDDLYLLYIFPGILARTSGRFPGSDILEFLLPETQQGDIDREMVGYFLDGVEETFLIEPDWFLSFTHNFGCQ